jgi:HK97 family phage major capsid protein
MPDNTPAAGSATTTTSPAPGGSPSVADLATQVTEIGHQVKSLGDTVATLATVRRGPQPSDVFGMPYVTTGPLTGSGGFSMLKAAGLAMGFVQPDDAKDELNLCKRLHDLYVGYGFAPSGRTIMVPYATEHIPSFEPKGQEIVGEIRQKMAAGVHGMDPDEMRWVNKRLNGIYTKALGTIVDTAGGNLVPLPGNQELIDLQRNLEVFTRAGASEVTMPPNGRLRFPKLTGGATAYWVGEGSAITDSQQTVNTLDLNAKKLGVLVKMNNELIRFASPSAEALVRGDMARVGALKMDLAMLEGTGGTQPKGLLTYDTQTAWTSGTDKMIAHTPSGSAADGNSGYPFLPQDVQLMLGKLPDEVANITAWVMRRDYFSVLAARRNDAVTAGDDAGAFTFNFGRGLADNIGPTLAGAPVIRSAQVSASRTRGSGTTSNTYILAGYFPDWIIARMGVMEFLMSTTGDTPLVNDQTWLRGIMQIDAGARHAASFVFADNVLTAY